MNSIYVCHFLFFWKSSIYYSGEFDLSIGLKIVKFFKGELYCFASVYGTDYGRPESK